MEINLVNLNFVVLGEDQIKLIFRFKPNLPTLIQFKAFKKFVEILRKTNFVYYNIA